MSIIQPIEIFDQNNLQQIDYDNLFPICYDQIQENNSYKLEECNHKFHTDCIIKWLRTDHSNCPMCNGIANQNQRIYYRTDRSYRFKLILNYSRRKNASKKVVNIVNKYKKINKKYIQAKKEFSLFNRIHKNIFKEKSKYQTKIWRLRRSVEKLKRDICVIPVHPIIIK